MIVEITGEGGFLEEVRSGWSHKKGLCLLKGESEVWPLGVNWSLREGLEVVNRQSAKFHGHELGRLPDGLGHGFLVNAPSYAGDRPYYVIAHFRCGEMEPWLSLDISKVQDGRDYQEDLTALMRIAEKRFGVLHECEPGPVKDR